MKTYQTESIDEAIEMAEEMQNEGRYNWFRGQRKLWSPVSSLRRLQLNESNWEKDYISKMGRFYDWLINTSGIETIAKDYNQFFAVMQHYGMPTHYLDFSTDPAVAGFFATEDGKKGDTGCIFCLNTEDFTRFWPNISEVLHIPQPELISVNVPNLWRLEAQKGCFLYYPTEWHHIYDMDRILFPQDGCPSYPTKDVIYPHRKSQLEILLDQFFSHEVRLVGSRKLKDFSENNKQVICFDIKRPPNNYYPQFFKNGVLEEHSSWSDLSKWLDVSTEKHSSTHQIIKDINVSLLWDADSLMSKCKTAFLRVLRYSPDIRNHMVDWKMSSADSSLIDYQNLSLNELYEGLQVIWSGMRTLPCSNEDIAIASSHWVALWRHGYSKEAEPEQNKLAVEAVYGEVVRIEMEATDGSDSYGYVSAIALRSAVRDDIDNYLTQCFVGEYSDKIENLLLSCFSVRRLFDFQKLCPLFMHQIVPTQMGRYGANFFHPARLNVLGIP